MTKLYLDASVVFTLFTAEPGAAAVQTALAAEPADLVVSDFATGEVAAAFTRKMREQLLSESNTTSLLDDLDGWTGAVANLVEVRSADIRRATALVRRFDLKLRLPDALHLAICEAQSAQLVTRDKLMGEAARSLDMAVLQLP